MENKRDRCFIFWENNDDFMGVETRFYLKIRTLVLLSQT
jgi:hypothetical protein